MKKIFFVLLILFSTIQGFTQIKMGDFPILLGRGDSVKVAILLPIGGGLLSNRTMWGHDLAYGKVDSVIISNDSVYEINSGRKRFRWMRSGGTGNGTITKDTAQWGKLIGNINLQSDLIAMFNTKQNAITLGTTAQYFRGNLTPGTLQTDVLAFTDPRYAALLHTHSSADITDFTGAVRAQFTQGTGINISAGVISWTGSSGTGLIGHINSPLSLSGDTLKLLSVGSSIITGTKDHNYISDLNTTVLGYFSGIAPVLYNNGTGAFSLDTANAPSGIATKGRLLKGLDSVHTLSTYTKGYGLNLSANQFSADSIALASRLRLYKTIDSMNQVNLQVLVAKDSLGQYPIWYFPPLHVAYDSLHGNKIDSVWIDVADTGKAGVVSIFDFKRFDNASNKTDTALSVQNFILISKKLDGTTIQTALPKTPAIGSNGDVQLSDGGGGFKNDPNFNLSNSILGLNNNDLQLRNTVSGITGIHWLKADRFATSVASSTIGSEIYYTNSFVRIGTGSSDFGNTFGSATYDRIYLDQSTGISLVSQAPYGNKISLQAGTVSVSPLIGTGTRMVVTDANGVLGSQAIPSGGGSTTLTSTRLAIGSVTNTVTDNANLTFLVANNGTLQLGNTTASSTATPALFDMGGTYFSGSGNVKFALFDDGTHKYGFGVAAGEMDYVIGDAVSDHVWYANGNPYMRLTNGGILQVGTGDLTGMPTGGVQTTVYNSSSNGTLLGSAFRSNQTASNTGSIQALEGYVKTSNASGNVLLSIGTIGNSEHSGAGTISTMRGGQFGTVIKGNGNVSIAQSIFIAPVQIPSGTSTVTNSYGIWIDDASAGGGVITNKYNIYAHDAAGINYFAGNTQVNHLGGNSSTPSIAVGSSVTGTVSVVGNDLGGTITLVVTSPSSLATSAELVTLTFASAYSSTPNVVFSPANSAAIGNTPSTFVKGTSTSGFSIATSPSIASLGATTYIWTYKVSN